MAHLKKDWLKIICHLDFTEFMILQLTLFCKNALLLMQGLNGFRNLVINEMDFGNIFLPKIVVTNS